MTTTDTTTPLPPGHAFVCCHCSSVLSKSSFDGHASEFHVEPAGVGVGS